MSPGQYLNTLRMEKTAELLETTSLTVKQIRAKVGMQDESQFVRVFKKTYGVTPSEYRARRTLP
jgi:AraC-like DNA-binding protein